MSQTSDLGFGKDGIGLKMFRTAEATGRAFSPEAEGHPGSWAAPIVADGRVYASSWRPAGDFHEVRFPDGETARVRLDAEDILVAIDFGTGQTLWKAAEPGGLLNGGGKRGAHQVAPVYHSGKVYSVGSTGRLFAYDAATGEKVWQSDVGAGHQGAEQLRKRILAALADGRWCHGPKGAPWVWGSR